MLSGEGTVDPGDGRTRTSLEAIRAVHGEAVSADEFEVDTIRAWLRGIDRTAGASR